MNQGAIGIWKDVLHRLRRNAWRLLFVHLVYSALGFVLLFPLAGVLLRFLIGLSGQQVLADTDIALHLLSPLGILSLILILSIMVGITALGQVAMMAVTTNTLDGKSDSPFNAVRFSILRADRAFRLAIYIVARILLIAAPFLAVGAAVVWWQLAEYDINYYLQARPPEFWMTAGLLVLLMAAMAALIIRQLLAWALALPISVFLESPAGQSCARSASLTAGRRSLTLRLMAVWALTSLALGALAVGLVQGLGHWLVPLFNESLMMTAVVLGGLAALWSLINLLVTAVTASSFAVLIIDLSERLVAGLKAAERWQTRSPMGNRQWRLSVPRAVLVALCALLIAALSGVWLVNGIELRDDFIIAAHRGAAGKAPENTLASIRQAIEDGADWVEIDVQETADGEVVVIHDSDFMKLAGVDLNVWNGYLDEIKAIDVGSWFAPEFSAERVPTLAEVLDVSRNRVKVVIELKYYGYDQQLEQRVIDVVEQAGMVSEVAIMSLNYSGIRKIRALRPDWQVGLLSATAIGDLTSVDADFLAVSMGMATPGFVRRVQNSGKQLFVWTVNDAAAMSRMMSMGVDGIITDEPGMARKMVKERSELKPIERLLVHTAVLFDQPVPARGYRDNSP